MLKRIICWLTGHIKYDPRALKGNDIMDLKDSLGHTLVRVNICKRCGNLYADYPS